MIPRLLLPLALAACGSATILPREPEVPVARNHLSYPIVRKSMPGSALRRRDDTATLYNHSNVAYMLELDIGTPAQKVQVQLDTGSNELWLDPDCSNVTPASSAQFCNSLGVYYPDQSSTANITDLSTTLAYGKGQAAITYVIDTIVIPGTNNSALSNVMFGVATASQDAGVPILGVGFGNGYNLEYDNMIDEMANQNAINGRFFSVALGTAPANSGEDVGDNIDDGVIIFGGVDTKKFIGPLVPFNNLQPQTSDPGQPWRYWVQLDSVGFTKAGSSKSDAYSSSSLPIVLDTGSSLSYLPQSVLNQLASSLDIKSSAIGSDGSMQVDCDKGDKGGSVDFTFGSLVINVPINDIVWEAAPNECYVGVLPSDDTTALFGDTFLRSVYTFFDQDNKKIYMAPAANCGTNEHTLPASTSYNITGECTVVQSAAPGSFSSVSMTALLAFVGAQVVLALL